MNKKLLFVALQTLVLTLSNAQDKDSSYLLKTVEIKSLRPNFAKANYLNEIFTANALQYQLSDLYIKNYGVGQLSTFSVRGLGAENVAILWQGIPVNSPTNGLLDLNQVPNSLLQSIQYNNDNSQRLTSGGSLSIDNTHISQNGLALSSTAYLSQLFSHKFDGQFAWKKSKFSFVNQLTHGKNDFEYASAGQRGRLAHNGVQQINSQLFYQYDMGKWQFLSGLWYQNQDRNIPESEFYPVQTQTLIDRNWRGYLGLANEKLSFKLAYMNESQKYNDQNSFFPLESEHKISTWKGVFTYKTHLTEKMKLNYSLIPARYHVHSTDLQDSALTIYEAIQQINLNYQVAENFSWEAGLKSQWNCNFQNFLLPYLAANYQINSRWKTSLIADINERNPTMNDLYYTFYGNINLKPETNYQIRNVWKYANKNTSDNIQWTFEPYFIHSVNKINYVPDSAFRVFNVDKSTSYGLTTQMEWVRKINRDNNLRTIVGLNYIDSKDGRDKYLAYVPHLKTILTLNWINKCYDILVQNSYTTQRYTNTANTSQLPAYFITNLKATYKYALEKQQINFGIGIDNLWNENYQEIQGSYMPLRNYYINITALLF